MPPQNNVVPIEKDELQELYGAIKSERGSLKKMILKGLIDTKGLAVFVEGTVLAFMEQLVEMQAQLRDGVRDELDAFDEQIAGIAGEPALGDEDAEKLRLYIDGTLALVGTLKATAAPELRERLEALEALGAECREIVDANTADDEDDEEGDEEEPQQPETDKANAPS